MAFLPAILAVAGTAVSVIGNIQAGQSAKQAADYNAAVATQRAAQERDAAGAETEDYLRKGSRTLASALAMQGAAGVTPAGSPLLVDSSTIKEIALGASRKVFAGETKAGRLGDEAEIERMKGDQAVTASYWKAGSSLLTGISKFSGFSGAMA